MSELAMRALLVGLMAAALFPPYMRWVQPRVRGGVEGGLAALVGILILEGSHALGAGLGWTSTGHLSVQEFTVECGAAFFALTLLAGFGVHYGWWPGRPAK